MRLLFIHSDHLEFEVREAVTEDLAETEGVPLEGRMEECATVFISVESDDEADVGGIVENALAEIRDVTGQLNTRNVVLYPYAHLSEDLASPDAATTVMQELESALAAEEYEILRAPFGWYKSFEVSCKGHPLSELSRHVAAHRDEDEPDETEREPSEWRVMHPDGTTAGAVDAKPDTNPDMRAFIEDEVESVTASPGEEPPHIDLMREKELVGYDELSDVGNLRFYPRGKLIRDALIEYVDIS